MHPALQPSRFLLVPTGLAAAILLGANAGAQDLFTSPSTDHVPQPEFGWITPMVHDFDADGLPDLVDAGFVLKNFGGTFVEIREPFTEHSLPLAFADFDGDGVDDILDRRSSSLDRLGVSFVRTPLPTQRVEFSFLGGGSLTQFVVGDFDGDGDPDLIAEDTSSFSPPVQVENLGGGLFQDVTAARMPTDRMRLMEGPMIPTDLDGDGDLDLIVRNSLVPGLSWMENQGGGVFAAPDTTPFANAPANRVLGSADVDGDGDLDLWVDSARLIENQGGAFTFAAVQPLPIRNQARQIVSADIDNDGDLDAWLEARGSVLCGWFENVGAGLPFADRVSQGPVIRREATMVSVTDINRDGLVDVVAFDRGLQVHRGQPNGRFVDIIRGDERARAYGDYDGDGLIDRLNINAPFSLAVQLNDGGGGFVERLSGPANGVVRIFGQADLDGDGDLDLLYQPAAPINGISVALNDGAGTFAAIPFPPGLSSLSTSRFGDFDGDGDLDLFLAARNVFSQSASGLLRNDGSGNFTIDPNWIDPGLPRTALGYDFDDADGDGDLDALVVGAEELLLLTNDGQGNFTEAPGAFPSRFPTTNVPPSELRVADLDGDGDRDVLGIYLGPTPRPTEFGVVFLNDGSGSYTTGQVFSSGERWLAVAVGDVDGDDAPDLLVGRDRNFSTNVPYEVQVLENDGAANFSASRFEVPGETFLRSLTLSDLDGDGDLDAPQNSTFDAILLNRTIDLRMRFVPQVGGQLELEVSQPDPARSQSALFVLSPSLLPAPLDIPGIGVLTVDPVAGATEFRGSLFRGTPVRLTVPVPTDPGLVGVNLFAQAVVTPQFAPRLTAPILVPITF